MSILTSCWWDIENPYSRDCRQSNVWKTTLVGSHDRFVREQPFVAFPVFCSVTFRFKAFFGNLLVLLLLVGNMFILYLCIMWKLPVGRKKFTHTHILSIHALIFWPFGSLCDLVSFLEKAQYVYFLWVRHGQRMFSGKDVLKLLNTSKSTVVCMSLYVYVRVQSKYAFILLNTLKI